MTETKKKTVKNQSERDAERLAAVFKALGHPVRVKIVAAAMARERCVCELQEIAGRDISTVSSHLNLLKNAGILVCEQRGKQVFYSLACPCLAEVFSCVLSGGKCA
ncbi:MAG: ArsR/SmtB family transcription factor [Candidatus Spyradosoma sp.]